MMRTFDSRFFTGCVVSWRLLALLTIVSTISLLPASGQSVTPGASSLLPQTATPGQPAASLPESGQPIERTLTGTEIHRYQKDGISMG